MLIESYEVEVFTPPCEPGAERFAARARLSVDISPVLPYLNATLRGAIYYPEAKALTWRRGDTTSPFTPMKSPPATLKSALRRRRSCAA